MAQSLRSWLKSEPVPHTLKCELEDGEEKTVRMGTARSRLRDAESACKGAVRVEALDADGATLRVWESPEAEDSHTAQVIATPIAHGAADQNLVMLTTMARLLQEAGDAGAARHAEAYQQVFAQYATLMQTVSDRLQQFEGLWQQMLLQRQEEVEEAAEQVNAQAAEVAATAANPTTSPNEQMVNTLLQGALMKMASTS